MEKHLLNSPHLPEEEQYAQIADRVIKQSLLEYKKEKLKQEIDQTLIDGNKKEFMRLTKELNSIS
ncbi:IDEAL domain-containing protein [Cytobacillus sp. FJAT-54145]|uniref:IDEAL domain-containing protein n=1 Tax=Cytobacillus spartinae TaxID=3299023 RepID=A0ABW6KIY9_9BACI